MGKDEGQKICLNVTVFLMAVLFLAFAALTVALGELKPCSYGCTQLGVVVII